MPTCKGLFIYMYNGFSYRSCEARLQFCVQVDICDIVLGSLSSALPTELNEEGHEVSIALIISKLSVYLSGCCRVW